MPSEPVTATTLPPVAPIPKRPTLYALAVYYEKYGWSLAYTGKGNRKWIEESQQPLHPGSVLVIVPGEEDAHAE